MVETSKTKLSELLSSLPSDKKRPIATALSSRAALRVLPLSFPRGERYAEKDVRSVLTVLRANVILRTAVRDPSSVLESSLQAQQSLKVLQNRRLLRLSCPETALSTVSATSELEAIKFSSKTIEYAAGAVAGVAMGAGTSIWKALEDDFRYLEVYAPEKLIDSKLFARKMPSWWSRSDSQLWQVLSNHKDLNFDVWKEWYQAVSSGMVPFNLSLDASRLIERRIAIGDGRPDFWSRGVAEINYEIKSWFLTRSAKSIEPSLELPSEAALQSPNANVTQFSQGPNGAIIALPDPPEPATNRDLRDLEELYEEARIKALEVKALGPNMLGQCYDAIDQLLQFTPEKFSSASINRIHAKVSTLRDRVHLHELQLKRSPGDRDSSLVLHEEVAVKLSSCVNQFNLLLAFDARGRELNSLQFGPEARSRADATNAALQPISMNIGDIGDQTTVNIIVGDNNAIHSASNTIHGDQAVVRTAQQNENLAMAVLQAGWRIAKAANDQGLTEPTIQFAIAQSGIYGPKILDFINRFDETFLWLAQHVDAFHSLAPLVAVLASYAISIKNKKN